MKESDDYLSDSNCDENLYMTQENLNEPKDYMIWKNEFLASLATKNKLPFLTERSRQEQEPHNLDRWDRCNELVKTWLLKCLSEDVKNSVLHLKFAYEIWNNLESVYGSHTPQRKAELESHIASFLGNFKRKPICDFSLMLKVFKFAEVESMWREWDDLDKKAGFYIPVDRNRNRALNFYKAVCFNGEFPELKEDILKDTTITPEKSIQLLHDYMMGLKPKTQEHHPDTSNRKVIGMSNTGRLELLECYMNMYREMHHYESISSTRPPDTRKVTEMSTIGLLGLNDTSHMLALRFAKYYPVSVCSMIDRRKLDIAMEQGDNSISTFHDCSGFVNSLKKPRVVIISVDGDAHCVEELIDSVIKYLAVGDIIIDASVSCFGFTAQRQEMIKYRRIGYLGMGVTQCFSRKEPSFVVSGDYGSYVKVEGMLKRIAVTNHDKKLCVAYVGGGGMGHYVHMVHNGVKHGHLHLMAECYNILRYIVKLDKTGLVEFFTNLDGVERVIEEVEISEGALLLNHHYFGDPKFIESVKWTVHQSVDSSVAAPTIATSLQTRSLCNLQSEKVIPAEPHKSLGSDYRRAFIGYVKNALYASILCTYIQGIKMIVAKEKSFLNVLSNIMTVWKGHCFIDPICLDEINVLVNDKYHKYELKDFISQPSRCREEGDKKAEEMRKNMRKMHNDWKEVTAIAIQCGISVAALSSGLDFFEEFLRTT